MKWLNLIQNSLFPPTCILCDNRSFSDKDICQHCLNQLVKNSNCCHQCGILFNQVSPQHTICGQCLKNPPVYDHTIAPFVYEGAMRYLISTLKFHNHYKNARLLGHLLAEHLQQTPQLPQCIIPVPLHKRRYRERGFNQSIEVARTVAKQLNMPLDVNACIRHRNTPHQTGLSAKQRDMNIKNAFSVPQPLPYNHIAILDDVMTRGATAGEMAKVLKKAGATKIEVWVCARTRFS
jgi:ComF family protein